MILGDACSASYDLASLFRGRRMQAHAGAALYTDGVQISQTGMVRGRQLCIQLSIFEGSLAELLVNFENLGKFAELLRF